MPPDRITSDLGDTTEDEEVQRDPRASSTSLLEEAQVGNALSFSPHTDLFNLYLILMKCNESCLRVSKAD